MAEKVEVVVNGVIHDSSSVVIRIGGKEYEGILGIKYSQKRTRTRVKAVGKGGVPIGKTKGTYNAEDGSITMLRQHAQMLRDDLAAKSSNGKSYGDTSFPITVQTVEEGTTPIVDALFDCCIAGDDGSAEESSTDGLKEEIPFSMARMTRNGKTLYQAKK